MMRIQLGLVTLLVTLVLASHLNFGLASPSTVPAFLWSPHLQSASGEIDEAVNYQVMSAKDLVDSVFTRGGWSNLLCSEKKLQQPVDWQRGKTLCIYEQGVQLKNIPNFFFHLDRYSGLEVFSLLLGILCINFVIIIESFFLAKLKLSIFRCIFKKLGCCEFYCSYLVFFYHLQLLSSDVSSNQNSDPALVKTLKNLYTASNFSLAFPYISAPEEERMENLLLSGFKEACAHNVGVSNIVFSDSCFVEDGTIQKLSNVQSFKDHLVARKETRREGETDLVVLCSEGSESSIRSDQSHSDREIISELVSSVEQSGTKYAALYVSDPYWYSSYQTLQRFLAETATGNSTVKATTTCDELCKFKSSLLEGILVGIVLLIILISGLCCMAGIDTPTRFETPQD